MCKMAVLGRGSMRDRKKVCVKKIFHFEIFNKGNSFKQEEELRLSGEHKYSHLTEDLHVEISTFAPPAEAHARIAYALGT